MLLAATFGRRLDGSGTTPPRHPSVSLGPVAVLRGGRDSRHVVSQEGKTAQHVANMPAVIGVVGGVASGKSMVADCFRRFGCELLDGDVAGHEALRQPDVIRELVAHFGRQVAEADGGINRRALAHIVFGQPPEGPRALEYLERVTHPRIGRLLERQLAEATAAGRPVVLDAAVMFKAGWDAYCDKIVYVDAPREVRLRRSLKRGWPEAGFEAREDAQQSLEEKRRRADVIIDNSGLPEGVAPQVERFWQSLTSSAPENTPRAGEPSNRQSPRRTNG